GNARDIEWGIKGGQIFMLQSRPVTNLDNSYTDYEIMHEVDTPHQTEFEIYSRAHWGENFPGASSWLVFTWTFANKSQFFRFGLANGRTTEDDYNPYTLQMGIQYNQLMFNLTNSVFSEFFGDYPESDQASQMILAFFGHHIEDKDVLDSFKQSKKEIKKINLIKDKTHYMDVLKFDMVSKLKGIPNSKQILDEIIANYMVMAMTQFKNHGPASMGSSIKHMFLRKALEGAKENNPELESDFNLLISSCNEVISAEVPNTLREIAKSIKDKQLFRQMSDEMALKTLMEGTDESSQKFKDFLEKHGHRGNGVGYRELSKYFMIWMNNKQKQAFRYLANQMVIEGLIPSAETFFYLTAEEVESLCNGSRDPLIFAKVRQRRKLYPKMDKYKFDEFVKGPQMKPRNFEDRIVPPTLGSGMVQMKGTPVSNGSVRARVCVSEDITEADTGRYTDHILDRHRLESILPSTVGYYHRNQKYSFVTSIPP
ncbi:unnamed protein product, partial [Oppiella nova]